MSACQSCGADLETPLACGACGALGAPAAGASPFELLGLPLAYRVDATDLRKRLLRFSRMVHPDFFAAQGDEARERAEANTALLNAANETLIDPARRADWLVRALGGPSESDERQMPQAFLMEVLEWNEALEEARDSVPGAPARTALAALEESLIAERATILNEIEAALEGTPEPSALADVRKKLNALRYIGRTLAEMRGLRLEQAATR